MEEVDDAPGEGLAEKFLRILDTTNIRNVLVIWPRRAKMPTTIAETLVDLEDRRTGRLDETHQLRRGHRIRRQSGQERPRPGEASEVEEGSAAIPLGLSQNRGFGDPPQAVIRRTLLCQAPSMAPQPSPADQTRLLADAKDLMHRQASFHDSQVDRADWLARIATVELVVLTLVATYLAMADIRPGPITLAVLITGFLGSALALFGLTLLAPGGDPRRLMAKPGDVDKVAKVAAEKGVDDPLATVCAFLVTCNTRHLVRTSGIVRSAWWATVSAGAMALEAALLVATGAAGV